MIAWRVEREHRFSRLKQDDDPARPIICPLCIDNARPGDAEEMRDLLDFGFIDLTTADKRWRSKGQVRLSAADRHQAHTTFLNDLTIVMWRTTCDKPGVTTAKG